MNDPDEVWNRRLDAQQEAKEEADTENRMAEDLEYCLDKLGLEYIYDDISGIAHKATEYGHQISITDICDLLGDM